MPAPLSLAVPSAPLTKLPSTDVSTRSKHRDSSQPTAISASRSREELRTASLDYQLQLSDGNGRSVSLSLSYDQLSFRGTYDRFGAVQGGSMPRAIAGRAGGEFAGQSQAFAEHRQVSIEASSFSLAIEGDVSLLQDHFGSERTADRILDHALSLTRGLARDSDAFSAVLGEIESGIRQGFAEAESMLGNLMPVSHETRSLLDLMLEALHEDPTRTPRAADFLEQVRDQED